VSLPVALGDDSDYFLSESQERFCAISCRQLRDDREKFFVEILGENVEIFLVDN
jgi:hypothetical protein